MLPLNEICPWEICKGLLWCYIKSSNVCVRSPGWQLFIEIYFVSYVNNMVSDAFRFVPCVMRTCLHETVRKHVRRFSFIVLWKGVCSNLRPATGKQKVMSPWVRRAKLRIAVVGFVMSLCPSVRTEQLGSHWRIVVKFSMWAFMENLSNSTEVSLKSDKSNGYST